VAQKRTCSHAIRAVPPHTRLAVSGEHRKVRWVSYDEARSLLKWDSNGDALWELNERLKAEVKTA
jgi:hypothetical protein